MKVGDQVRVCEESTFAGKTGRIVRTIGVGLTERHAVDLDMPMLDAKDGCPIFLASKLELV